MFNHPQNVYLISGYRNFRHELTINCIVRKIGGKKKVAANEEAKAKYLQ